MCHGGRGLSSQAWRLSGGVCMGVSRADSGSLHPQKTYSVHLLSPSEQRDLAGCPLAGHSQGRGLALKSGGHGLDQKMLSDSRGRLQTLSQELERRGQLKQSWVSLA